MKERVTFTEAEDKVESSTSVPETEDELMERVFGITEAPPYIIGLMLIRMGGELLKRSEHHCLDCENPACFGKPQHQQFVRELLLDKMVPEFDEKIKELQEQVAVLVYQMANCDCEYCEAKDKKNAAQFN